MNKNSIKKYLVQVFESCYSGRHFICEKVVIGDEGIREYLENQTFVERIVTEVVKNHEYITTIDIIIVKEQNEDGSFDSYNELPD